MQGWVSFDEVYDRETVKDCLSLWEELWVILGEGWLSGTLR